MRLGQVAWALGINEKTADNAIRTLGLARPLDEDTVRALGLALRAKHRYGIPLKRAFPIVREALIRPRTQKNDAVLRDVLSYLPEVERELRSAIQHHTPLPRGPGWRDPYHPEVPPHYRRHPAIRRAIQWGLDLSLNLGTVDHDVRTRLGDLADMQRAGQLLGGSAATVNLTRMLEDLASAQVRFVIIGGVAATAHGSARLTADLDMCYDIEAGNGGRLARLLKRWNARLYLPREPNNELPFVIDARTLRDGPALTLVTDHGRLDLLPVVTGIGDYAACVAASEVKRVGALDLRILTLDALIKAKRAAGRRRDREHLIELEALRALQRAAAKPARAPRRRRR